MTTMMNRYPARLLAAALLVMAPLGGCESLQSNPKQAAGGVLGGVGGGVLGSQLGKGTGRTVAMIGGTLIGALLGSEAGKSLDRADRVYVEQSAHSALETAPTGTSTAWNNPDTGHSGAVTPTRTFRRGDQPCREFTSTINVGGRNEPAVGTACRDPDGTWRISQ
ncbi:MAG: RT0821/Lpp0805 family surface protein [Alphaproteobacteria bacterium]